MSIPVQVVRPETETFVEGFRRRTALTGLSLVYVLLAVPVLAMLCLVSTSLSIAVIGVGLVLLLLLVPLTEQLADLHRHLSGRLLGVVIERPYAKVGPGSPWRVLRAWANDPARWRDYLWTWMCVTVGWAVASIAGGLGLVLIWYAAFPLIYAITPPHALDINYGVYQINSGATSFLEWIPLLIAFAVWWKLVPVTMRWRAQLDRALLSPSREVLERRVAEVATSRSESIDHSAAELRRIERDLHDGAQARLVALGMNLGMAQEMLSRDPEGAAQMLAEARSVTTSALGDLRSVVRGIHPPILSDRGLAGAIQALALDMTVPVSVLIDFHGRPPAPVESAVYFATSELLANIGKHAEAHRGSIEASHDGSVLRVVVRDDGRGGAVIASGTGLAGLARRLAVFDGTMDVISPVGGPTVVTLEVPCALSSPKISPSSGTA